MVTLKNKSCVRRGGKIGFGAETLDDEGPDARSWKLHRVGSETPVELISV